MKWFLVIFTLFSTELLANDEILNYFGPESELNVIYWSQSQNIDKDNAVVVAYAINNKLSWQHHKIGIFLVKPSTFTTLDIFPTERSYDYLPFIERLSQSELIVSINSDYGELKKIQYILKLDSEPNLIKRIELEPKGIPDDLP